MVCGQEYAGLGRCVGWPICPRKDMRQRDFALGRCLMYWRIVFVLTTVMRALAASHASEPDPEEPPISVHSSEPWDLVDPLSSITEAEEGESEPAGDPDVADAGGVILICVADAGEWF